MAGVPDYGYYEAGAEDDQPDNSFLQKAKDNPMLPIGILGGIGALIYSAKKFKNRGDTRLSLYLIHTRVAAQGAVVGALTLGVLYSMFNEFVIGKDTTKQNSIRKT